MDRLPTVVPSALIALAALLVGCGDDKRGAGSSRDRVNAVKAKPEDMVRPAEMCDVFPDAARAPAFAWPKLASAAPAAPKDGWRWVNVWATWCKPCVEELPRLPLWIGRLEKRGVRVALELLSADESAGEVASFRAANPKVPPSLRMADPDGLAKWLGELGVPGATLPVHVFVNPAGRIRCVRASELEETDYPAIEALLRGAR
jgi:thiol-disulfide isomerase/thioredoxin